MHPSVALPAQHGPTLSVGTRDQGHRALNPIPYFYPGAQAVPLAAAAAHGGLPHRQPRARPQTPKPLSSLSVGAQAVPPAAAAAHGGLPHRQPRARRARCRAHRARHVCRRVRWCATTCWNTATTTSHLCRRCCCGCGWGSRVVCHPLIPRGCLQPLTPVLPAVPPAEPLDNMKLQKFSCPPPKQYIL